MQQFTTQEQTAKLIELGFEPKQVPATCGWADDENYSIGELLSFLPTSFEGNDYYALTIRGSKVMYCDPYLDWIEAEWAKSEELIDNLFDACVELKEEGVL